MKKFLSLTLALVTVLTCFAFIGCQKKNDEKVIKVGASSTPHAEILEQVKKTLADQGYTLEVVVFDDYVMPNKQLADGALDANYFQHTPFMNAFNKTSDKKLTAAALIHYEPFGLFGNGVTKVADIKKGATIIVPADDSNETRALLLLQQEGLIKLPDDASAEKGITVMDIVDNGGFEIKAVSAETVPAQLKNSDAGTVAVINGNYALAAGLKVADALAVESVKGDAAKTYANVIAVREGDEKTGKIKALVAALESVAVKEYMEKTYNGAVQPMFSVSEAESK